jgi:hypothetical protein
VQLLFRFCFCKNPEYYRRITYGHEGELPKSGDSAIAQWKPTVFPSSSVAAAGGLINLLPNLEGQWRRWFE